MLQLPALHGLRVVGLDIDPSSLTSRLDELTNAITKHTRFIVFPHLFGVRQNIDDIVDIAKQHKLDLIEDCAQSYDGTDWTGESRATISLFSFGPLKTSSAIQGGIAVIRESDLHDGMTSALDSYPQQSSFAYAGRITRFLLIKVLSYTTVYGLIVRGLNAIGSDHEQLIHRVTKSTRQGGTLLKALRLQPCGALVEVLSHKIGRSLEHIEARTRAGTELVGSLGPSVVLSGRHQEANAYWAIVVLPTNTLRFKEYLRKHGFDALSPRLVAVDREAEPGARALEDSVMLPFSPRMPMHELRRLGELVTSYFEKIDPAN